MFGLPEHNVHGFETGKISDVVKDVHYGTAKKASENGKYIYIRMNNITYEGNLDLSDIKHIDVSEKELAGCMVQQGDVLFNRTNSKDLVGKTCYFSGNEPMIIAGYIIRLRMNGKVVPEYLSIFMNLDRSKKLLYNMAKGAVGQANINSKEVQSIEIVIPPEGIQRSFLLLLKQSDKSKFYGKSQFIEMFGDPVYNTMDWPTKPIKDIAPESNACIPEENEYWWLNLDMIESYSGMLVDKVIEKADAIGNSTHAFDSSMVLYSKLRPYLNKAIVPDGYGYATTELVCLKPNPVELNKYFLFNLLRGDCFLNFATKCSSGAQMPRMPMRVLREFPCILPPMELQNKFVEFAEQSDKSKLSSIGYMF